MDDPASPLYWTPEHVWKLIDHRLLDNKLTDIALEMQLATSKNKGAALVKRSIGSAGYSVERARLEGLHQDEYAEKRVQTCIHVWETQGYPLCPNLYRAIYSNLLEVFFKARNGAFTFELAHVDQLAGQPGRSRAVLAEFERETQRRCSRWSRKMDTLARECEHAWRRGAISSDPKAALPTTPQVAVNSGANFSTSSSITAIQPSLVEVDNWNELAKKFQSLADQERGASTSPLRASAVREGNKSQDVVEWFVHDAVSDTLREQFELCGAEAARALGAVLEETSLLNLFLHRLYQYLCDRSSPLTRPCYISSVDGDGTNVRVESPAIEKVCEASTAFCLSLQKQALEGELTRKTLAQRFREWVEDNSSSAEPLYWSTPDSVRRLVTCVARGAKTPVSIDFLSARLNINRLPLLITKCESLRAFFDQIAREEGLVWCVTQRGLWMARKPPIGMSYVDSDGRLHGAPEATAPALEGKSRSVGRPPVRGGLYAAAKQLAREKKLEERLRKEIEPINTPLPLSDTYGMLSFPEDEDRELLREAIREVAIPSLDREKREQEAKRHAPINFPPLARPLIPAPNSPFQMAAPSLSLTPAPPESRQEILKRFREKRRGTPLESFNFDAEIGERMHKERQTLIREGHKTKRQRASPTLPDDVFEKIVKAADAVRGGKRRFPLNKVLPPEKWKKVASHNQNLGGSARKLESFDQLRSSPLFKNMARARFNRAETYYRTKLAGPLSLVQESSRTRI